MKMKDNNYYTKVIVTCTRAITLAIFGLDFVLVTILLA